MVIKMQWFRDWPVLCRILHWKSTRKSNLGVNDWQGEIKLWVRVVCRIANGALCGWVVTWISRNFKLLHKRPGCQVVETIFIFWVENESANTQQLFCENCHELQKPQVTSISISLSLSDWRMFLFCLSISPYEPDQQYPENRILSTKKTSLPFGNPNTTFQSLLTMMNC